MDDCIEAIVSFKRQPEEDYYAILGCDELSSEEQILREYRIRAKQRHPDKMLDCPDAVENFRLLQTAKDVLCNSRLRNDYDRWRHSGILISFKDWKAKTESGHISMHWMMNKRKEPMLENVKSEDEATQQMARTGQDVVQTSASKEDLLRKFRSYEI